MPELEVIGHVPDGEPLDLEPLIVPVAARRIPGGEEVVERFNFRPAEPMGATVDLHRHTSVNGATPFKYIWNFLDACLLPEELERWSEFLHDGDLLIEQETLIEVYQAVIGFYGSRPTRRSSGSLPGGQRTRPTSRGAARSRGSAASKNGH